MGGGPNVGRCGFERVKCTILQGRKHKKREYQDEMDWIENLDKKILEL